MSGYGVTLGLCGFMLLVLSILAFRVMLEIFLVFFLLCFVAQSTSLRPIQSLTSGKGLPSRPVDRDALILRVALHQPAGPLRRDHDTHRVVLRRVFAKTVGSQRGERAVENHRCGKLNASRGCRCRADDDHRGAAPHVSRAPTFLKGRRSKTNLQSLFPLAYSRGSEAQAMDSPVVRCPVETA